MGFVAIAGPPDNLRRSARKLDGVLPGPAPHLQHVPGASIQERRHHRPDWPMISVERRSIQAAIRPGRCSEVAKPDNVSAHVDIFTLAGMIVKSSTRDRGKDKGSRECLK